VGRARVACGRAGSTGTCLKLPYRQLLPHMETSTPTRGLSASLESNLSETLDTQKNQVVGVTSQAQCISRHLIFLALLFFWLQFPICKVEMVAPSASGIES